MTESAISEVTARLRRTGFMIFVLPWTRTRSRAAAGSRSVHMTPETPPYSPLGRTSTPGTRPEIRGLAGLPVSGGDPAGTRRQKGRSGQPMSQAFGKPLDEGRLVVG